MLDAILAVLATAVVAVVAFLSARYKREADRAKRQLSDYQRASDRWQADAARRIEAVKKRAVGKAPIDPGNRADFE